MASVATKAKVTRALSSLISRVKTLASVTTSNGLSGNFRIDPIPVSERSFSSSAVPLEPDAVGSRVLGLKDYEDHRRALYGGITHKALLVDAVGTLVIPSQPMAQIYRQIGEKYGVDYSEEEILKRYRRAYEQPWGRSRLRFLQEMRRSGKKRMKGMGLCKEYAYCGADDDGGYLEFKPSFQLLFFTSTTVLFCFFNLICDVHQLGYLVYRDTPR